MSFREPRRNSSVIRRERVINIELSEAKIQPLSESKVREIVEEVPLSIEGGSASVAFQDDQIVLDGGSA